MTFGRPSAAQSSAFAALHSLLLPALVLGLLATGCKSEATCTDSSQCANGFECNTTSSTCEAVLPEPDAAPTPDAAAACPQSHFCTAAAPDGWSGPVVGATASQFDALVACPSDYSEEAIVSSDLVVSGGCDCECPGVSSGVVCGNASVSARQSATGFGCVQDCFECANVLPSDSTCTRLDNAELQSAPAIRVSLGQVQNTGVCSLPLENDDFAADFGEHAKLCSATSLVASCPTEGDACLPVPDDEAYAATCIFQAGDHECPAAYSDKTLRFAGITDDRSCSACTCSGPAVGDSCGGQVTLHPAAQPPVCTTVIDTITSNTCVTKSPALLLDARYTPATSFDCTESGAVESGEAVASDPVTVCCVAE